MICQHFGQVLRRNGGELRMNLSKDDVKSIKGFT
jgi:hypothetical protein